MLRQSYKYLFQIKFDKSLIKFYVIVNKLSEYEIARQDREYDQQ